MHGARSSWEGEPHSDIFWSGLSPWGLAIPGLTEGQRPGPITLVEQLKEMELWKEGETEEGEK